MLYFDELDELEATEEAEAAPAAADAEGRGERRGDAAEGSPARRAARTGGGELRAASSTCDVEVHRNVKVLSLQQARHAQSLIIREYLQDDFQKALREAQCEAEGDPEAQAAACEQLSVDVQIEVARQHGFPASPTGVALMGSAFVLYAADSEVQHRSALMRWLLDPAAQLVVPIPRGAAVCVLKAVLLVAHADGNPVWESAVDLESTVRAVKENIAIPVRKPWHSQRLFLGARELFDREVLSSLVHVGSTARLRLEYRRPELAEWLARLRRGAGALAEAPPEVLGDPEFLLAAVQVQAAALEHLPPELRGDRALLRQVFGACGQALQFAPAECRGDRELVLAALRQDAWALEFAAPELRQDREVVLAAVLRDGDALEFAAPELQADAEIVMTALRRNPSVVLQVPQLLADRKVVIKAVTQDWRLLEELPQGMRTDREVVMAAVRQSGRALRFAAPERRADHDVVLVAVRNHGEALRFAAPELLRDHGVLLPALRRSGMALGLVDLEVQNLELALAAVRQDRRAFQYVDQRLRKEVAKRLDIDLATEGNPWLEKGAVHARGEEAPPDDEAEPVGPAQHFAVLDLPETASREEVRRRYHQLALRYHPDKYVGDEEVAKQMFQKIQTAYEVLCDSFDF